MMFRPTLVLVVSLLVLAAACERGADREADEPLLSEGDQAPGFTLSSASGERIALSDFTDHKPVLLYFSMGPG